MKMHMNYYTSLLYEAFKEKEGKECNCFVFIAEPNSNEVNIGNTFNIQELEAVIERINQVILEAH